VCEAIKTLTKAVEPRVVVVQYDTSSTMWDSRSVTCIHETIVSHCSSVCSRHNCELRVGGYSVATFCFKPVMSVKEANS
jgi:hypothetical protein